METIKSLQGIIAFVKAAETGSFSQAAVDLGVSKSHVSKTILLLEKELGAALFLRSTRKIQLTNLGERYLATCKQSVANLAAAKKEILDLSETPRGNLRVTLAGIFGEEHITPVLIEIAKNYPDLKVELDFSNRVVDLIAEKFDAAIRIGDLKDSSMMGQKLGDRAEYVVCAKSYLAEKSPIKDPTDLTKHNCIGEKLTWTFKKRGKTLQVPVSGNLKSNNPRVIHKAALQGLGIARLPGSYVFDDIKKGKLVSLLEPYAEDKKGIWVVTPSRPNQNIAVKIFIQELKKHLKGGSQAY